MPVDIVGLHEIIVHIRVNSFAIAALFWERGIGQALQALVEICWTKGTMWHSGDRTARNAVNKYYFGSTHGIMSILFTLAAKHELGQPESTCYDSILMHLRWRCSNVIEEHRWFVNQRVPSER